MPTTTAADGTLIAYDVEGSGPPLVLLHGITENRRRWAPIVDRLRGDFTCVGVDARGHGESEPARSDYDVLTMAADVATVVEDAGLDPPPVVVGHSLGAMIGTAYAAAGAPARGVVNVDQSLRITDLAVVVRPLEPQLRGPAFADAMEAVAQALGIAVLPPAVADDIRAQGREVPPDVVLGIWAPLFEATDDELMAQVAALAAVRVPYLAIHGADPGPGYADWLATVVPDARVEVWDGDAHWLHLVEPDRFADRIRTFASSLS